jgi:hypothetical protein
MRFVSYQGEVSYSLFPELLAFSNLDYITKSSREYSAIITKCNYNLKKTGNMRRTQ